MATTTTVKNLSDEEIKELLEEAFKKLRSTAEQDSKKLSDLNAALNWILTFSTVFFIFYTRTNFHPENFWDEIVLEGSKYSFLLLVLILILHKIFFVRYEDFKGAYLASLHSHLIDLKFNIDFVKPKIRDMTPFATYMFINSFRDGEFLYHHTRDESIRQFKRMDLRIKRCGNWLKATYWIGLTVFIISFLLLGYVLLK